MPAEAGATPSSSASALQRRIDELSVELRARTAERDKAMKHERALAEVLEAINASAQVPTAVFDVILDKVMRLCTAAFGYLMTYDGDRFQVVASHRLPARFAEYLRSMDQPGSAGLYAAIRRGSPYGQVADLREGEVYRTSPLRRALVDLGGARTGIVVALRKDDSLLGVITIYRQEVRPFDNAEIALLQNFAAQAVIAMGTSRLLGELRESEARHALVSDAVAEGIYEWNIETNALWVSQRLIEIFGFEGRELKAADWNELVHPEDFPRYRIALRDCFKGIARRLDCEYRVRHADGAYRWIEDRGVPVRNPTGRAVRLVGALTDVTARKESERALSESLKQQTATAEVLQVINSSPGNLGPVFDATLESATRLCDAAFAILWLCDGERFHAAALHGVPERYAEVARVPCVPSANNPLGRMLRGERLITSLDAAADDLYRTGDPVRRALVDLGGARSFIQVALIKDDELLGSLTVYRQEVRAFSEKQIALLQNFAAQAVIAMENARLITETREALERQLATSEILQVINSSPGNLLPVFEAMLEKAAQLCAAPYSQLAVYDGEWFQFVAVHGEASFTAQMPRGRLAPSRGVTWQRLVDGDDVVHVPDLADSDLYRSGHEAARQIVDIGGGRSLLTAALRKGRRLLGALTVYSREARPFTDKQIALLQNFGTQAVIAMENARLLTEQREALEQQTATAEVLKVINASPGNLEPVFMTVLEKALRLCEAAFGVFWTYDGNHFHASALLGVPAAFADFAKQRPHRVGNDNTHARALRGEAVMHIVDAAESEAYRLGDPLRRALVDLGGARTSLGVALRKDDALLGVLILYRKEVRPFSERQISLIESFAGQAVVAMENARLLDQLHQRTDDLARSVDELSATGDVLKTISRSSTDLKAVLDTLLETVARLCRADQTYMFRRHEELHHLVAAYGVPPEGEEYIRTHPFKPGRGTTSGRVALQRRTVHIEDVLSDPEYTYTEGQITAGFRTMLGLPLLREDTLVGVFVLGRTRVEPFSPKEIELVSSFADQAVIAIENARLFEELRDRQAELRVTFDNMGDGVAMFDGDHRLAAWNRNFEQIMALSEEWLARRPGYSEYLKLLAERGEFGTENVEAELASRLEDTEQELRLERTRADGTVIEVRRNAVPGGGFVLIYSDVTERRRAEAAVRAARDAAEAALERQTATADILKVIASSPTDVQPVLEAVVKAAVRFCSATDAMIQMREGDSVISTVHEGPLTYSAGVRRSLDRTTAGGRSIVDAQTCHLPDVEADDAAEFVSARKLAAQHGFRASVAAPLKREGTAIGAVVLRKVEPGPFTPQQIQLLETFAAQAVIAIENVRLFTELRESLDQQTATGEILRVIAQSPTDVKPVLDAVANAALRFCGANDVQVCLREAEKWFVAVHLGPLGSKVGERRILDRETGPGRAITDGKTVQLADVQGLDPVEFAEARKLGTALGFNSALCAPMMRDQVAIGGISLRRPQTGSFSERQIALLESFAAQAVIAIENVRLFTELRESLERLKAAQANLIQAEKMASLGQLTAGIAHEIKNPLNFVNNFAGLSGELLDELKQGMEALLAAPDDDKRAELQDTMDLLTSNLAKIAEHGRRADGIVKSMLSHSRGGTGDWQPSNINALVEEALNLAYHGARAQDKDFNVTLERDFTAEPMSIEVVPQDVTRVFLNLFGNGFYATRKRHLEGGGAGYRPTLRVSTRDLGEAVEVRVRDNGTGIQPEVRAKLFQPFFTTKPTGEGTGLGLSISYDIVTQQHGGAIDVESEPGAFTEFTVRLPRRRRAA